MEQCVPELCPVLDIFGSALCEPLNVLRTNVTLKHTLNLQPKKANTKDFRSPPLPTHSLLLLINLRLHEKRVLPPY
jgi:hypothetical protein